MSYPFVLSKFCIFITKFRTPIFNPYEKIRANNSHIIGTGLGLAISKELIDEMGG